MMNQIFFDLPCVFVYLDDLLVTSHSIAEHCLHLRQVLQLLQDNGLVVNKEKCLFGQTSIEFLGHTVHAGGVSPLLDRVAAVRDFPRPTNYYHWFVPAAAKILKPLTDALQGGCGLIPNCIGLVLWRVHSPQQRWPSGR
jgi:Reverse transcriptase (RNA-dependent DNA polymerase)